MECRGRRGRRGRNHSRPCMPPPCISAVARNFTPCQSKPRSFCSALTSFFIMSTLMALIYLMLEYHCTTCDPKCNINNITKNINDIATNLGHLQKSYQELELQITRFSQELPRVEGQIEILEALAHSLDEKNLGWNPKKHSPLPNVDVYLTKFEGGRNVSRLTPDQVPVMLAAVN